MAAQRSESTVTTTSFTVAREDGKQGVIVQQTAQNGNILCVSIRGFAGKNRSAATILDDVAVADLHEALGEILEDMQA